jgi:hypothetical protein
MDFRARPRGSDTRAERPALCAIPAAAVRREKSVPNGKTGGGKGTVVKPSQREISMA